MLALLFVTVTSVALAQTTGFTVGGIAYTYLHSYYGTGSYMGDRFASDSATVIVTARDYVGPVNVPSTVTNAGKTYKVVGIGRDVFDGTSVTSVSLPGSIVIVDEQAFYNCPELVSVSLPASVDSIGGFAFSLCPKLTSVQVAQGSVYRSEGNCCLTRDGRTLVFGCATSVIPEGVTSIAPYAFYGCTSLASIELPTTLQTIGDWAFFDCSGLASIGFPDGLTQIGRYAFFRCTGLTSVSLPQGLVSLGKSAFQGCLNMHSALLPSTLQRVGASAFFDCLSLTGLALTGGVTTFDAMAFADCPLDTLNLPKSVTHIGRYAFTHPHLNAVKTFAPKPAQADPEAFGVDRSASVLYVPAGSVAAYSVASGWSEFGRIEEHDDDYDDGPLIFRVVAADMVGQRGQVELPLRLENSKPVVAWRCQLALPEGINIARDADGDPLVTLRSARDAAGGHTISVLQDSVGHYQLICSAVGGALFAIGDEPVATVTLDVDEGVAGGIYDVYCHKVRLYEADGAEHYVRQTVAQLTIPRRQQVSLTAQGLTPVCLDYATTLPEGITAFCIEPLDADWLRLREVSSDTLPAGTPVFLKGEVDECMVDELMSSDALPHSSLETMVHGAAVDTMVAARSALLLVAYGADDWLFARAERDTLLPAGGMLIPDSLSGGHDTLYVAVPGLAGEYVLSAVAALSASGQPESLCLAIAGPGAVTSWQADLYVPEGVALAVDDEGSYQALWAGDRHSPQQSLTVGALAPGAYTLQCTSDGLHVLSGRQGEVAEMRLAIDPEAAGGACLCELRNVVVTDVYGVVHECDSVSLPITLARHCDVSVSESGVATMYVDYAVRIPDGVSAYTADSLAGDWLIVRPVAGVIPAGTGVLLEASEGTYRFDELHEAPAGEGCAEGKAYKDDSTSVCVDSLRSLLRGSMRDSVMAAGQALLLDTSDGFTGFLRSAHDSLLVASTAYLPQSEVGLYDKVRVSRADTLMVDSLAYALRIHVDKDTLRRGTHFVARILLDNDNAITSWRAVLHLPAGCTLVSARLVEGRLSSSTHELKMTDDLEAGILLQCSSPEGFVVTGCAGAVAELELAMDNDVAGGIYKLALTDVRCTGISGMEHKGKGDEASVIVARHHAVQLNAAGRATLSLDYPVSLPTGVKASTVASVSADWFTTATLASAIPARTGVIIEGSPSAVYTFDEVLSNDSLLVPTATSLLTGVTLDSLVKAGSVLLLAQDETAKDGKITTSAQASNGKTDAGMRFALCARDTLLQASTAYLSKSMAGGQTEVRQSLDDSDVTDGAGYALRLAYDGDTLRRGTAFVVTLSLDNANAVSSWQAALTLPQGFELVSSSVSGNRLTSQSHALSSSVDVKGCIQLQCTSKEGKAISGQSGKVAQLTLRVGMDIAGSTYKLALADVLCTGLSGKEHMASGGEASVIVARHHVVQLDAAGRGTLSLDYPVSLPTGVKASTVASVSADWFTLSSLSSAIPAKTGVIIDGNPSAVYAFDEVLSTDGLLVPTATSLLTGVTRDSLVKAGSVLLLAQNDKSDVGKGTSSDLCFVLCNKDTELKAGTAYLSPEITHGFDQLRADIGDDGQWALTSTDAEAHKDAEVNLLLSLESRKAVSAWQAEFQLPNDISFVSAEAVNVRTNALSHTLDAEVRGNGRLLLTMESVDGRAISGQTGPVAVVRLKIAHSTATGVYPLLLRVFNVKGLDAQWYAGSHTGDIAQITVLYTLGDVDDDSKIDGKDLVTLANFIIKGRQGEEVPDAADFNRDGIIDGVDYVGIANLILSNEDSGK